MQLIQLTELSDILEAWRPAIDSHLQQVFAAHEIAERFTRFALGGVTCEASHGLRAGGGGSEPQARSTRVLRGSTANCRGL